MRSITPDPTNPWPHDMTITVENRPTSLLELLWIREAYQLHPDGANLPPLLTLRPSGEVRAPSAKELAEWTSAWPSLWTDSLLHAGKEFDPALHQRLSETTNGSRERRDLLQEIVGPSWHDRFGSDALDEGSYRAWNDVMFQVSLVSYPTGLESDPLRRDLDAVIAAWRTGMTKIITIPCHGEYVERVGDNALLITEQTMTARDAFRRALSTFA